MNSTIRAAAAGRFLRDLVLGGRARGCSKSSRRGRGANVFTLLFLLFVSCAPALDFHPYRACNEKLGTMFHDPGWVVNEYLGEDNRRHFTFLPDRQTDKRNTIDLTSVNRTCRLVYAADGFMPSSLAQPMPPIDASQGRFPQ